MFGIVKRLVDGWRSPPRFDTASVPDLSVDIGCGSKKRSGYVGVDVADLPGVDHRIDLENEPLPFDDASVGRIFSSHCLEHLQDIRPVLREISRVCADGATVELWTPYSWHGDAHFADHRSFLNERQFMHMGVYFNEFWEEQLGARWRILEVVYNVNRSVLADLKRNGVEANFALRYFKDVCHEMGVIAEIDKSGSNRQVNWPHFSYATSRCENERVSLTARGLRSRVSKRFNSLLWGQRVF